MKTITRAPEVAATDEDAATTMYRRKPTEEADAPRPRAKTGAAPQHRQAFAPKWLILLLVGLVVLGVALTLEGSHG